MREMNGIDHRARNILINNENKSSAGELSSVAGENAL